MCHVEQVTRSTHNQCCVLYLHASRSLLCGNAYMYQYEVLVHVRGGGRCKESSSLFPMYMYVVLVVVQSTDELYLVCCYLLLFSMLYLYIVSQGYCDNYKVIFVKLNISCLQ